MITHLSLTVPSLPPSFDGLTVAAVADVHAGVRRGGDAGIREIVEQVNAQEPDLIVLLGDQVHICDHAERHLSALAGLRAREGVWACLGNHEHGFVWFSRYLGVKRGPSVPEWRRLYAQIGIEVLANEARPLTRDGTRLWVVGVDDVYSGHDDLPAALPESAHKEFCLLISHHPDIIDDPAVADVDLVLAGHTHGGQVHIPVIGPVHVSCRNPRERAMGLVEANGTVMYVSRGAGEGLPLRIGCPREVPIITLRAAPGRWDRRREKLSPRPRARPRARVYDRSESRHRGLQEARG